MFLFCLQYSILPMYIWPGWDIKCFNLSSIFIWCLSYVYTTSLGVKLFYFVFNSVFVPLVKELIQSRGNFCMMRSHLPGCLKGIPSSNKNMLAVCNMRAWGV